MRITAQKVLDLYNKLVELIHNIESTFDGGVPFSGAVAPGPISQYCSLFWQKHHIYISFLQICTEFFCEAIKRGIPLRGCISTGMATMDAGKSIFFGRPLVEAARGEPAQDCIGVSFGRSFNNYHPAYNRFFIPYMEHRHDARGLGDLDTNTSV